MFYIYKMKDVNYIGSAVDLKKRLSRHKTSCYNKNLSTYNYKVYKFVRENNITIKLIPIAFYKRKCSNKIRKLIEQFYINKYNSLKNGLNTQRAFCNRKIYHREWRKKNKEKLKKYRKINNWSKLNYERKKQLNKKHNNIKTTCKFCGKKLLKCNILRHQKTTKCKKFQ